MSEIAIGQHKRLAMGDEPRKRAKGGMVSPHKYPTNRGEREDDSKRGASKSAAVNEDIPAEGSMKKITGHKDPKEENRPAKIRTEKLPK
jgi:hypothetical protein